MTDPTIIPRSHKGHKVHKECENITKAPSKYLCVLRVLCELCDTFFSTGCGGDKDFVGLEGFSVVGY